MYMLVELAALAYEFIKSMCEDHPRASITTFLVLDIVWTATLSFLGASTLVSVLLAPLCVLAMIFIIVMVIGLLLSITLGLLGGVIPTN